MEKAEEGTGDRLRNLRSKMKNLIFIFTFCILNFLPLALAGEYEKELNHCLIQARIQYDNSRYEEAIEWWSKALKLDSQNKEALKYIKKAQEKLDKTEVKIIRPQEKIPLGEFSLKPSQTKQEIPEAVFERPKKDILTLEDAVELGFKNHLPIQIAKEQVKLARLKEKEVFRELFPAATIRWDESSGVVSNKDYSGRKYQLKMVHPLYHGGELRYTWEQAKVNLKISNENYEKTKEDYSIELEKAYYDFVKTIKNFNAQEALLKDLERDVSMAKKEFDEGLSTLVEFLNVQSQYNQAYYSYLSSENTLSLAKLNFLQLLNLDKDPTSKINIDTTLDFKNYNVDLEKCISLAYENRSDLKINELALKAAEFGEQVAKSQQLPKVDLIGSVGKSGEAYTPGNLQLSDEWFLGAKVSVPWGPNTMGYSYTKEHIPPSLTVFTPTSNDIHSLRLNVLDNLTRFTEAKQSEITYEQAYSDFLKGKQKAAAEVREAYFNYQETVIKVKNSIANKELYQKELVVMKERRLINEAQTQDVVSSKVKLASEGVNYNSALVENFLAIAKLNKAMGIRNYFK